MGTSVGDEARWPKDAQLTIGAAQMASLTLSSAGTMLIIRQAPVVWEEAALRLRGIWFSFSWLTLAFGFLQDKHQMLEC